MSDFYNKYPYTDFHELNLDWVIERVKKLTEDWAATSQEWDSTEQAWNDLHDYVMNYFNNLDVQDEINNKLQAMYDNGDFDAILLPLFNTYTVEINNKIAAIEQNAATPNFVPTTADMTDTSKFYVLTTNGHIYYYSNGWVDSGLIYGSDVNSFTYGFLDGSTDMNSLPNANKIYTLNGTTTNSPYTPGTSLKGIVITVASTYPTQTLITNMNIHVRIAGTYPNWQAWVSPVDHCLNVFNADVYHGETVITNIDMSTLPKIDKIIAFNANLSDAPISSGYGLIITSQPYTGTNNYGAQFIVCNKGLYTRVSTGANTFTPWIGVNLARVVENGFLNASVDLDTVPYYNRIYTISASTITNGPVAAGNGILITTQPEAASNAYATQTIMTASALYTRIRNNNGWTKWNGFKFDKIYKTVTVGTGQQYTSILQAMKDHPEPYVEFVLSGETFDLEQEYIDVYGADFWDDYDNYADHPDDHFYRGLSLEPYQKITGQGGAELKFDPATLHANVQTYWSILNTSNNNEISNLILTMKNDSCRYAIHDDFSAYGYNGIGDFYIHDITINGDAHGGRSIGGGMGYHCNYKLENIGIFTTNSGWAIDYHNCQVGVPKNQIHINNVYAPGAKISITPIGDETYVTPAYITNCKCSQVEYRDSLYNNHNMVVYEWNNDIS